MGNSKKKQSLKEKKKPDVHRSTRHLLENQTGRAMDPPIKQYPENPGFHGTDHEKDLSPEE